MTQSTAASGHLEADRVVYDIESRRTVASGHASLSMEKGIVRADEIEYSEETQEATARGHVRMIWSADNVLAGSAESVSVKLQDGVVTEIRMQQGRVLQKKEVTFEALAAAESVETMMSLGVTTLAFSGSSLERLEDGAWRARDVVLTPCDCDLSRPSWKIQAKESTIDFKKGFATFLFPSVSAPFPMLWLPWLVVPLSQRQTGFLVPKPTSTSLNGFALETPFFLTLGDSFDLTLTPGYFSGVDKNADGALKPDGVKGPRLLTEFRYAPSEGTQGRMTLGFLDDSKGQRNPVTRQLLPEAPRRGLRFEGSWQHQQDFGRGWLSRVAGSAVSDGLYVSDLTPDVIAREAEYLRSTAVVARRLDDSWLGIDVTLRQDLRWGYSLLGGDRNEQGPLRGPATLQRLPALTAYVPERHVGGPFHFDFRGEMARLAPILGNTGDEGSLANGGGSVLRDGTQLSDRALRGRLFCPTADCATGEVGQGDGQFQEGEREARTRLDVFPRVTSFWNVGSFLRLSAQMALRQSVYFGEATRQVHQRGYPLAGLGVDTELSRTFAKGQIRHSIVPSLEGRYVPTVWGTQLPSYDAVDASLAGQTRLFQVVASVKQSLHRRRGQSSEELARLELGQGMNGLAWAKSDFWAEAYARLLVRWMPFTLETEARYELLRGILTQASAGALFQPTSQLSFSARYDRIHPQGSFRMRSGIDTLFGPAALSNNEGGWSYSPEQLNVSANWSFFKGLGLTYNALVFRTQVPSDPPNESRLLLRQHRMGVSYAPACQCWKVEAFAIQIPDVGLPFPGRDFIDALGASVTIANFGSVGTGG